MERHLFSSNGDHQYSDTPERNKHAAARRRNESLQKSVSVADESPRPNSEIRGQTAVSYHGKLATNGA